MTQSVIWLQLYWRQYYVRYISKLSPLKTVSNIHHQHRYSQMFLDLSDHFWKPSKPMLTRTLVECGVENIVIQPGILKSEKELIVWIFGAVDIFYVMKFVLYDITCNRLTQGTFKFLLHVCSSVLTYLIYVPSHGSLLSMRLFLLSTAQHLYSQSMLVIKD